MLRPGSQFYCEEILRHYIKHLIIGKLMDHPQKDWFDQTDTVHALSQAGFEINAIRQWLDLYLWIVASSDQILAAIKHR